VVAVSRAARDGADLNVALGRAVLAAAVGETPVVQGVKVVTLPDRVGAAVEANH
jgi:hypothetical protein